MNKINKIRLYIQLIFLSAFVLILLFLGNSKTHLACPNNINCVLFSNLQNPGFLASIGFYLSLLILIFTVFSGRKFCAYICPLGTVQDILGFIKIKKQTVSPVLYYLKYIVLILILIGSYLSGKIIYQSICPVEVIAGKINFLTIGFWVVILMFIASIIWRRFFCIVFCPYAALMNIAQFIMIKISGNRFPLKKQPNSCVECTLCSKKCSMGAELVSDKIKDNLECIRCTDCYEVCPPMRKELKEKK